MKWLQNIIDGYNNIEKHKKDWFEENQPLGKSLGYPDCCIKAFCDQPPQWLKTQIYGFGKEDINRYHASFLDGKYTGFFPCAIHAKQILDGKITLESLIKDRDREYGQFPNF